MSNITSLVNTQWFIGMPFNDTSNLRLGIVESGEQILGQSLIGVQGGNEPDLYGAVSGILRWLAATLSHMLCFSTVHARVPMHRQILSESLVQ